MKILVVLGSIREGRVGDKVSDWVMEESKKRAPEFNYEFLDLKGYPMKSYEESAHPAMLDGKTSDKSANKWIKKVKEADAFIFVTPEYNHLPSGALKNAIDYPYNEWHKKPIAYVSYGGASGGSRVVEILRLAAVEQHMVPIRESVVIQFVHQKVEDNKLVPDGYMSNALTSTFDQLEWWTKVTKKARES
jgi:NAD(P)H-dependent FMN reductase